MGYLFDEIKQGTRLALACALAVAASVSCADPVTWTVPAPLNSDAFSDSIHDTEAAMESGENTLLAVWRKAPFGSPNGTATMQISRSFDSGRTWGNPLALPASDVGSPATPYYLGSGVWLIEQNSQFRKSTDNGATWSGPYSIGGSSIRAVGTNKSGTLLRVLALTISSQSIDRSTDGGQTWSDGPDFPINAIQIVHSGGNNWVLLTESSTLYSSTDDGISWSSSPSAPDFSVDNISTSHNGTLVASGAVLTINETNNVRDHTQDCYASVSTNNGLSWTPGVLVSSETHTQTAPVMEFRASPEAVWLAGGKWAFISKYVDLSRNLPFDINRTETVDVFVSYSEDGAVTWSPNETALQLGTDGSYLSTQSDNTDYASVLGSLTMTWETNGEAQYNGPVGTGPDIDTLYKTRYIPNVSAAKDWSLFY